MVALGAALAIYGIAAHALLLGFTGRYEARLDLALLFLWIGFGVPAAFAICLSLRLHPVAALTVCYLFSSEILWGFYEMVGSLRFPTGALVVPAALVGTAAGVAPVSGPFYLSWLPASVGIGWARLGVIAGYGAAISACFLALGSLAMRRKPLGRIG